jgi:stress-induced morphogen
MPRPEEIRERIAQQLPGARVEVTDTTGAGDHFDVRVRAAAFGGKSLVEQHQLVYGALGGLMAQIHALSLHTEGLQEGDDGRRSK